MYTACVIKRGNEHSTNRWLCHVRYSHISFIIWNKWIVPNLRYLDLGFTQIFLITPKHNKRGFISYEIYCINSRHACFKVRAMRISFTGHSRLVRTECAERALPISCLAMTRTHFYQRSLAENYGLDQLSRSIARLLLIVSTSIIRGNRLWWQFPCNNKVYHMNHTIKKMYTT